MPTEVSMFIINNKYNKRNATVSWHMPCSATLADSYLMKDSCHISVIICDYYYKRNIQSRHLQHMHIIETYFYVMT